MKAAELFESAKTIDSLYKEFLGRGVDPDGLRYHMQHFRKLGFSKGTQRSVNILMNSDEFQINKMHRGKIMINHGNKKINGKPVSHIISLGSHCLPALTLRKYGLKGKTLPFDWTYAPPIAVLDCLKNNFTSFIDNSNIHTIEKGIKSTNLKYWWDSKFHTFPHHDLNIQFNIEKFERYITRFNETLKSDDGKLFIIISRRMYDLNECFLSIRDVLLEKTNNFHLIGIQLINDINYQYKFGLSSVTSSENCELYNFSSRSLEEGFGQYQDASDELLLLSLITQFDLDLKIFS